jgi:hypothetical protein
VTTDYAKGENKFTGTIKKVTVGGTLSRICLNA